MATRPSPLVWSSPEPGKYVAADPLDGSRWFISQFASKEWRVFHDGDEDTITHASLRDAKFSVEDDRFESSNPEIHAKREAARAARRARHT